jgi:hypothetical protein
MKSLFILSSMAVLIASPQAEALTLAETGAAMAVIMVADDATEPEKYAAAELARFLHEVTGAEFDVTGIGGSKMTRLLVGPGAARDADPGFSTDGLGADGIVIRTMGGDLILAGGRPRGTLYAVYTFLEDAVGCRWWSSKASTIPRKPSLTVERLDIRYVPPLEYREPFWFDAFDADWAARNKSNGHRPGLQERHGGHHVYQGFVHTFYPLVAPKEYFEPHPEWFSEIDGKRTHERAQLCLTNEDMRRELVKNLKQQLRANPRATIASVSQNDWHGNCICAKCAAVDAEEGSPAGSLVRFVNAVAEEIEQEFPQVAISTLAYQYTRKPPKHVKPRPNVIIRLCSIECSFSKPLSDDRNQAFRDDIIGWSKICNRLYIWDYTTNFRHYILPHPNLRVLGPNVKFFVDHGARGIFEQGAYQSYGAEMAELRAWVLAKLLWNPSLDDQALIDEFLDGYYGPAAPHVRAYVKLTHDAVEASGDKLGCYSPVDAKFLSYQTLYAGWRHLEEAEAGAGGDAELRQRVRVAQMPLLTVYLLRWDELRKTAETTNAEWPLADNKKEVYDRFMETAQAAGVTMVSEQNGLEWMKTVLD